MSIPLKREPPDMGPAERCCFCRTPSRMWTDLPDRTPGQQVACCERCASERIPEEVPTKEQWFRAERIIARVKGRTAP